MKWKCTQCGGPCIADVPDLDDSADRPCNCLWDNDDPVWEPVAE